MIIRQPTSLFDFRNPVRFQGLAELIAGGIVGAFVGWRAWTLWPNFRTVYDSVTTDFDAFVQSDENVRALVAWGTLVTVVIPWGLWAISRLKTGLPRLLTYGVSITVNSIGGTKDAQGTDLGPAGTLKAMLDQGILPDRQGLKGIVGSAFSAIFPPLQSLTTPQRWVMQAFCRSIVLVAWAILFCAPEIGLLRDRMPVIGPWAEYYPSPTWLLTAVGLYAATLALASLGMSGRMKADSLRASEELADLGDPLDVHRRLKSAIERLADGQGTTLTDRKPNLGRMQIGQRDEFTSEILFEAGPYRAGRSVPRSALLLTLGGVTLVAIGAAVGLSQPFGPPAAWASMGLFGLPWVTVHVALLCGWSLLALGRRVHGVRRLTSEVWRVELDGTVRVGEVGARLDDGGSKINDSRSRCSATLQAARVITEQDGDAGARLLIRGETDDALRARFEHLRRFLHELRDEDAILPTLPGHLRPAAATGGTPATGVDATGLSSSAAARPVVSRSLPDATLTNSATP